MATTNTKSIKGTQTEKNLVAAYLGECQAYTRYTIYGKVANKEQYFPVQQIFEETAANELHHAKIYFGFLQGGQVQIPVLADAGVLGSTVDNLKQAIEEEQREGVDAYIAAAKTAREEGFPEIASHFEAIASVERHHEERFRTYLDHIQNGTLWKRDHVIRWQCLVCGYIFEGTEPPKACPGCDHPYQHYIALDD